MATRRAVANGNWSATGTWNGGVVPTNGDTVYANGFNVTLDTDVLIGGANNPTVSAGSFVAGQWYEITFVGTTTWTSIGATSNTAGTVFLATGVGSGTGQGKALATLTTSANAAAGASAGGNFIMSTIRQMTADLRAGTTICLDVTASSGTLALSNLSIVGGSASNIFALRNNSTAAISITSCSIFGGSAAGCSAISNASSGSVTVTTSTLSASGYSTAGAINNASTGSLTITSSTATAGNGGSAVNAYAINNASTGTIYITGGTLNGGSTGANASAVNNNSTGSVTLSNCSLTGGGSSQALNNASTGGVEATACTFTASAFANAVSITNTSADVRLSGDFLDHWSGWKAISGSKWRIGTAPTLGQTRYALAGTTGSYFTMYGADNGSFGNPIAANVRSGVSYGGGNLTGTCAVPAAGSVAFGVPVDNTTGTAVLTVANVQSALTAQGLTTARAGNLDNLDATVSSRLSPSGTLATVTTLTNAPTVPSASAIASQVRSELSVELSRIDAATSTRATPANIPTSEISAIKGKTDLLNTTRLAQVSTTEIVGNLLAQANS